MATIVTRADVKAKGTPSYCLIVIHNRVYDVTPFLSEHPGGPDVLAEFSGNDCTQDFEGIGHSPDARVLMAQYYVGDVPVEEKK